METYLTWDNEGTYLAYTPDYTEHCKDGLATLEEVKQHAPGSEWLEMTENGDRVQLEEGRFKVTREDEHLYLVNKNGIIKIF